MRLTEARLPFIWSMLSRKSRRVSFLFPICPGISNKTLLASSVYSKFDIVYNGLIAARRRENHCRLIWVQNEFKIKIAGSNPVEALIFFRLLLSNA